MEMERPELRADGGASSSSVARYLSDAGLSRTHSYTGCEDLELEIRCQHLREIADRIELAHSRMLNEHDRRALAIAEQAPYARFIPFYPELPSENGQINHTAQLAQSVDKNKKRKKEYGNEVIQVKPTMQWSKWPCVWCSVNFDSKEAMDAHLQEQHQGCQEDGASESEKVEKNRSEEARTSLAVTSDGNQMEISEVSEPHASKKIHLDLSPSNIKQKHDKVNKDKVVPVLENKENIGSNTSMKMKLVVPPLNLKRKSDKHNKKVVVPTPEHKDIAGSHAYKKIKLDLPPSKKKPDKVMGEEFVQSPQNKEIASSNINRKMKLDFPSSNSKQKSDEPSKEKVVPTSESKEIAGSSNNKRTKLDLSILNLEKKFVSAIRNGSQKSNSTNRMVTEKPVQGACQAESVPKLEGPKEIRKDPSKKELVQTPESKEIAGFSNNTRGSCANPSKPNEPSREEVMPTLENKEIVGFSKHTRGSCANPSKPDEPRKEEAMPTPENKEITGNNIKVVPIVENKENIGSNTSKKMKLVVPPLNLKRKCDKPKKEEVLPTPENKEITGSDTNKKIKLDLPPSNLIKKPDEVMGEEFVQSPHNKQIAGSDINRKMKLDFPSSNSKQKSDDPSKEKVMPSPKSKEIAGCSDNKKIKLDFPTVDLEKKSVNALRNGSQNSNSANRIVTEKPVQGASQAVSGPKLVGLKETCKDTSKEKVVQTSENKEIAGSSNNKKIKLDFPTLNLEKKSVKALRNESQKSNSANRMVTEKPVQRASQAASVPKLEGPKETRKDPSKEEVVQTPENEEIAGFSNNTRGSANLRKSDEPSKEEVVPTPENKEIAGSSNNKKIKLDLPTLNLEKKSVKALQNGSQKSNSANRMVTEKPVQGASQGASVPKLEGPKGTHKDPSKEETVQTPENIEIAGISNNTRGSHANLRKPYESSKKKVLPTPENKEIAGFRNNIKVQLDLPTSNLEQKSLKPNKVLLTPGNKETAGSGIQSTIPTGHKKPDIGTTTERTLEEHFQSNDNNQKLKSLLNESQKSRPANRMMTEKFVQGASQAASMPKLEDPKEVTSKSVTLLKPVQGASQAASVPKLEDPKEETSKSATMPKPVQGASQAASSPKMVKPKEETSKPIPMPQANKLKEVTSQDNANLSLKSKTVILSGHRKTSETTAEFSEKKKYVLVNGTTMPMLVMKDGKWFCNLCQATWMTERCKEEHISGKRHWLNLQAQDASCRSEPAEPVMVMTDGTTKPVLVMTDGNWFCKLCETKQMSETVKDQHINSRRHKHNLEAQAVSYRPEPAKPPARLHWCFICNIVYTTEDNLIAHYNGKRHREVLMNGFRGAFN